MPASRLAEYRWASVALFPCRARPAWLIPTTVLEKSALEKLILAAALKETTSVSMAWLAQRLQTGATDSVGSLLTRIRAAGGLERAKHRRTIPDS